MMQPEAYAHRHVSEQMDGPFNLPHSALNLNLGAADRPVRRPLKVSNISDDRLLSVLWACCKNKDLSTGTRIHHELHQRGLSERIYSDALITMYAKCGEIAKAQALLDMYSSSGGIPWTALMAGYARQGQGQIALACFEKMKHENVPQNAVAYTCAVKACAVIGALDKGKQFHDEVLRQRLLEHHPPLGGALVDMYAKCGALLRAKTVLANLPSRDVFSWSALISGYAQSGRGDEALEIFQDMQHEGVRPNAVTYLSVLKACAVIGAVEKGKQIHDEVSRQGLLEHNVVLAGALVDMYAKCGALFQAQAVVEKLPFRNLVLWSSLISGYALHGQGKKALECYERMRLEGIPPNTVTYLCVLKACATIGAIDEGRRIHEDISRQGLLEHDIVLGNAVIDMYAKCGAFHQAKSVLKKLPFRNVVSWSSLIAGYVQNGNGDQALQCFEEMQSERILPDVVAFVWVLNACAIVGALDKGKQIHEEILKRRLLGQNIALDGALVDMYAKCGDLARAQSIFDRLPSRDVISWSALIAGYAQKGQGEEALACFHRMRCEGSVPNAVTYGGILKACAVMRAIDKGKEIHDEIMKEGLLEHEVVVGTALVDMYAKCGALSQAQSVLKKLPFRDVVVWNSLIAGYVQEGHAKQALESYEQMQLEGILPNKVTFICLLSMCSHLGLMEKGQELFDCMRVEYGLEPDVDCHICMIDLLGRAGHLVKAVKLSQEMPCAANSTIWLSLLGACLNMVDVDVGMWAFEQAVDLDKCDESAYVLMMNLYVAAGMNEKAKGIEELKNKNRAWKQPGHSSLPDSRNIMHEHRGYESIYHRSKESNLKQNGIGKRFTPHMCFEYHRKSWALQKHHNKSNDHIFDLTPHFSLATC